METKFPTGPLIAGLIICIAFALMLMHMGYKHKEKMLEIQLEYGQIEQPIAKSRSWK
jgi:hypothetical protein